MSNLCNFPVFALALLSPPVTKLGKQTHYSLTGTWPPGEPTLLGKSHLNSCAYAFAELCFANVYLLIILASLAMFLYQ